MPALPGVLRLVQPTQFDHVSERYSNVNAIRFRYRDKHFAIASSSPIFFLDRHSEELTTGFGIFTDYVNILDLPMFSAQIGGAIIESNGHRNTPEVLCRYGVGPDTPILEDSVFQSFKTYENFFSGDYEDACLGFKKMMRELSPWTGRSYLRFISPQNELTEEECRESIEVCARVGFELWYSFLTFTPKTDGMFEINRKNFPQGIPQARAIVEYAHAKGLKVAAYIGFMWAIWDLEDSELFKKNSWRLGLKKVKGYDWVERPKGACLASGYGDYIVKRCFELVRELKLDALDTDGPYDGFICYSRDHFHRSPEESQYLQWEVQRKFYAELQKTGLFIYSPQAPSSIMHGNNMTCCHSESWISGGNERKGMNRLYDNWNQVLAARQDLWFTSFILPPTCMCHALSSWSYLGEEEEEIMLDHCLATLLGYGVTSMFKVVLNDQNEPVFKKWFDFFKQNREILESDIVHLRPPDGKSIDAIMHVNQYLNPCGFIMAYNPTGLTLRQSILFPTKYFHSPGTLKVKAQNGKVTKPEIFKNPLSSGIMEGYMGNGEMALLDVKLGPREITWYKIDYE